MGTLLGVPWGAAGLEKLCHAPWALGVVELISCVSQMLKQVMECSRAEGFPSRAGPHLPLL